MTSLQQITASHPWAMFRSGATQQFRSCGKPVRAKGRSCHVCRAEVGSFKSTSVSNGKPQDFNGSSVRNGTNGNGKGMKLTSSGEWGSKFDEDWAPSERYVDYVVSVEDRMEAERRAAGASTPRDKWLTPLIDLKSITEAFDPDQDRAEDSMQEEALSNKSDSQDAVKYAVKLLFIPLVTGFVISRALAAPILSFTLEHNPQAFAMTEHQIREGAEHVHIEESRLKLDMAIGKIPNLNEDEVLQHLRHYALELQEEEREANEQGLITLVSDSISFMVLFYILSRPSIEREAFFTTLSRLFEGLSDIAKAVMIILIADTMLGYHSEEGWTGLIELICGHYGFEPEQGPVIIFVAVFPIALDALFKYWIFIGLNKISPGAVVTIKQIDRH